MTATRKSTSHTLTGRTTLKAGMYWLLVNSDEIHHVMMRNDHECRMGVHPSTHETVYHPINPDTGKVIYEVTLFGAYFEPERYPQLRDTTPGKEE